jgi:hypothetical protein
MAGASFPSVTPGYPLDPLTPGHRLNAPVMPRGPLDVSEAGTIQGLRPEEPGKHASHRRIVGAPGSLGKPNVATAIDRDEPDAVSSVNLPSSNGRYRLGVAMIHVILGIRARGQKAQARTPTVAWTIRGRVDHATVNVRLTSRCTAILRPRSTGTPTLGLRVPTLERTAAASSRGQRRQAGFAPRVTRERHSKQRSARLAEGGHGGSVPSGLPEGGTASSIRSASPQGGHSRQRSVRLARGRVQEAALSLGSPEDGHGGQRSARLARGRPQQSASPLGSPEGNER